MNEPTQLTCEEVIRFLISQGGRSTNHALVSYFRKLLNDPVNQVSVRLQFRDIVNNIATVQEEQGVKYVCLKQKYFNSNSEHEQSELLTKNSAGSCMSYSTLQALQNASRAQNYQPYWRYRLSSNANLVPPPPLLSFRLSTGEETNSLPPQLPSEVNEKSKSYSVDDSYGTQPETFHSLKSSFTEENENYHALHREDPVPLDSSWIHEQGFRNKRFYSEPRDVESWPAYDDGIPPAPERLRHNSIAVGMLSEREPEPSDSDQQAQGCAVQLNGSGQQCLEKDMAPLQPKDEVSSRDTVSESGSSSREKFSLKSNSSSSYQAAEISDISANKENICELNTHEEASKKSNDEEEDFEPRPHSESVKERARRIENMANELATSKTPLPVPVTQKSKASKSEKVTDDNASVVSQLDSKLRRQWFVKAAQSDYHAMVALLKKEPRLAGIRDITSGFTALHWAAKHGNAEVVKLIAGTHRVSPDIKSHGGYTCLHIATLYKHKSIVDLLIRTYGANPTVRDNSGKRADQYPPNYVSFTAGVNRRPADPRTSKIVIYVGRRKWSSLKSNLRRNKQADGKRNNASIRHGLRATPKRSGSESDVFARTEMLRDLVAEAP